jgi:hypothetical protein
MFSPGKLSGAEAFSNCIPDARETRLKATHGPTAASGRPDPWAAWRTRIDAVLGPGGVSSQSARVPGSLVVSFRRRLPVATPVIVRRRDRAAWHLPPRRGRLPWRLEPLAVLLHAWTLAPDCPILSFGTLPRNSQYSRNSAGRAIFANNANFAGPFGRALRAASRHSASPGTIREIRSIREIRLSKVESRRTTDKLIPFDITRHHPTEGPTNQGGAGQRSVGLQATGRFAHFALFAKRVPGLDSANWANIASPFASFVVAFAESPPCPIRDAGHGIGRATTAGRAWFVVLTPSPWR